MRAPVREQELEEAELVLVFFSSAYSTFSQVKLVSRLLQSTARSRSTFRAFGRAPAGAAKEARALEPCQKDPASLPILNHVDSGYLDCHIDFINKLRGSLAKLALIHGPLTLL